MPELYTLIQDLEHFSYLGVFIAVFLAGYLLPVPEEIVLLTVGYLVKRGVLELDLVLVVCVAGILAGDAAIFLLIRSSSKVAERLSRKYHKSRLKKFQQFLHIHIGKTILLFRFLGGWRVLGPVLAASSGATFREYAKYNAVAVTVYAACLILLGLYYPHSITRIIAQVEVLIHGLFVITLVALGIWATTTIASEEGGNV